MISHHNINVKKQINKGKLHLNDKDIASFVRNVRVFLNVFEAAWHESKHNLSDVSSSSSLSGPLTLSKQIMISWELSIKGLSMLKTP